MDFRFLGFDQHGSARGYRFDAVVKGEPTRHFTVMADMALFLVHGVAIQEGPTLCAHKLAADILNNSDGIHELTGDDLRSHAAAQAQANARRAEARKSGSRHAREAEARDDATWRGPRP